MTLVWENARHGGREAGDGAHIFPPHGRCRGACRGVAGVACCGGFSGVGLGWCKAEVVVPGGHIGDELVGGTHLAGSKIRAILDSDFATRRAAFGELSLFALSAT